MKRYIHSSELLECYPGFYFTVGNLAFFLKSDAHNLTDKLIRKFINALCDKKGVGDAIRQKSLYDKPTLEDFRRRISKCDLNHLDTGKVTYWSITNSGMTASYPEEDFAKEVTVLE